jgi:hypothetical protein
MKSHRIITAVAAILLTALTARAEVKITIDHNDDGTPAFKFEHVPQPLQNDAAAKGKFTVVDGTSGFQAGSKIAALNDGFLPGNYDSPEENFFFEGGTDGGRLQLDLGSVIEISQVNSFSWHRDERAPQVYKLYASDGTASGFNATPQKSLDPATCGWTLIAAVDTHTEFNQAGGQYGVSISDTDGALGKYRYFLFDISCADPKNPESNTFYSEIDVRAIHPSEPEVVTKIKPVHTKDFKYDIDISQFPDLKEWTEKALKPAIDKWYPILCDCLASEGYAPPAKFTITIKSMDGVAVTSGTDVSISENWIHSQLQHEEWNEATGSVIHELVRVVQQYKGTDDPDWLVEGIADYFRWFHYEPIEHRPKLSNPDQAKYSDGNQTTAGFLEYAVKNHDHELVVKLNTAIRDGTYRPDLWQYYTGMSVEDLWQEYVNSLAASGAPHAARSPDGASAPQEKPADSKQFTYSVDISQCPDLKDWTEKDLKPAIDKWYPILCASMPSEGFVTPAKFTVTIKPMGGVAYTAGTDVVVSLDWIHSQLKHEGWNQATGSIIHELVHVAQQYRGSGNPGWLVEGIADYFRWFHYEPIEHRPKLGNPAAAKYSDSYQTTAGFLEYVVKNHDHELVVKFNAAMRHGAYRPDLWQYYTGMSVEDLWQEYVNSLTGAHSAK